MEVEELINAVKEAVDERIESEKAEWDEAIKTALEPVLSRLEKIEEGLGLVDKAVHGSKQIDLADEVVSATKSTPRRDAWGRRTRTRS